MFGSVLFFTVGLGGRDPSNFFVFLSILITFAVFMNMQLSVFASFASSSQLQVFSACTLLFFILFGGFIVAPDGIPVYWLWMYWVNPFAWTYRALVVNEFYNDRWDDTATQLRNLGFIHPNTNDVFKRDAIGYSFLFLIPLLFLNAVISAVLLARVRVKAARPPQLLAQMIGHEDPAQAKNVEIAFKRVDLSFRNVCYEVTASTSADTLKLLHNVSGIMKAGRMCALMGSSGAGGLVTTCEKRCVILSHCLRENDLDGCHFASKANWNSIGRCALEWMATGPCFVSALFRLCGTV